MAYVTASPLRPFDAFLISEQGLFALKADQKLAFHDLIECTSLPQEPEGPFEMEDWSTGERRIVRLTPVNAEGQPVTPTRENAWDPALLCRQLSETAIKWARIHLSDAQLERLNEALKRAGQEPIRRAGQPRKKPQRRNRQTTRQTGDDLLALLKAHAITSVT